MNKLRVAINGFGRIGRMVFRRAIEDGNLDIVAVNASYSPETLAHLIKYDSIHGRFNGIVKAVKNGIEIDGNIVKLVSNRDPLQLPWKDLNIDMVIEATGKFKTNESASAHIKAGAKKVIITAPGKEIDGTFVMGVNEDQYNSDEHHIISNASCTTNCLAPVVKVLDDYFGIENGMMTTVHAFTNDQNNIDNPHKDLRRARGCTQSIIPTSTGAAKAIGEVIPQMKGKLHGLALRVPTPNVSLVDLVVDVKEDVTVEKVNNALRKEAETRLSGILDYNEEPLVSVDYTTTPYSSIIDGLSTMVIEDRKIKVLAWYDNEWGYSCRVVDLAKYIGAKLKEEAHSYS